MIVFRDLSLRIASLLLLSDVSLTLHAGQKLGVIGRNGAGKSSLFRLLMGELAPDSGDLEMPANLRISWMRQEVAGSARAAVDYVMDGHHELREAERALESAEAKDDFAAMARLHARMELLDGYTQRNRAEQLLSGLGFSSAEFNKAVQEFSGGWRIRLNLAQALMMPSDLLLLDEPTNHLDMEATIWLQQWLQQYQGTLLLISHDRMFLDAIPSHILSFESTRLVLYRGNYSAYEVQKAERLAQQQAAYNKQQQRVAEIEAFVRRFRAKASKATQAQSRLKELERMSLIAPAHVDSPFQFRFAEPDKLPDRLLSFEGLTIGYTTPLVNGIELNINADTRIGLLGANGEGKSTLLKVLAGQLAPLAGSMNPSDHLNIGYLAQHHIDTLDLNASPMQLLSRLDGKLREQECRNFLGRFDFGGESVSAAIRNFSGGEKARLALALLIWRKPNLLLLDEPTNHLDLEMRHALTLALQEYNGALILVSHDRHLLNNAVDQFMLVKDGKLQLFDGSLQDYETLLQADSRVTRTTSGTATVMPAAENRSQDRSQDKKEARQQAAARREQLKPLRQALKTTESRLDKVQRRVTEIEGLLADPGIYEDKNKGQLSTLLQEKGQLDNEQQALENEWLRLSEALEQP